MKSKTKRDKILVGTRGSILALAQTETVISRLTANFPARDFEIVKIKTTGDKFHSSLKLISGRGIFVKELEYALMEGRIELAVHSAKDLPSDMSPDFVLGAVLKREAVEDALVSRDGWTLETLPEGSRVATGSVRRQAFLRYYRPDLKICEIRGNVDTRLKKLSSGEFDATIMALSGLKRLNLEDQVTQVLPPEKFPPAFGQGAIAVQVLKENLEIISLLQAIDHSPTRACLEAERALLKTLNAGCASALGGWCRYEAGTLKMMVGALEREGGNLILLEGEKSSTAEAGNLGFELAQKIKALI
jgi:hydroxymethylbilane synthase